MKWYLPMVLVASVAVAHPGAAQETAYFGAGGGRWSGYDYYPPVGGHGVVGRAGVRGGRGLIQVSGSWFPEQDGQRWVGIGLEGGPRVSRGPVSIDALVGLGMLHIADSPQTTGPVCSDVCLMDVVIGPSMSAGYRGGAMTGVQAGLRVLEKWEATLGLRANVVRSGPSDWGVLTGWSFGATRLVR